MNLQQLVDAIASGQKVNWNEVRVEKHEERLLPHLKTIYSIVQFELIEDDTIKK